jgi:hypothetical protein
MQFQHLSVKRLAHEHGLTAMPEQCGSAVGVAVHVVGKITQRSIDHGNAHANPRLSDIAVRATTVTLKRRFYNNFNMLWHSLDAYVEWISRRNPEHVSPDIIVTQSTGGFTHRQTHAKLSVRS